MKKHVLIPWFASNKFYKVLVKSKDMQFIEFPLYAILNTQDRHYILKNWETKKEAIETKIKELSNVDGVICTLDWINPLKFIIQKFNELNIKTILIPHEGVAQNESLYYNNTKPICDTVLGWGNFHFRIFTQRGYPKENIKLIGTPKFDQYNQFKPSLFKKDFFNKLNLNSNNKTILFVCQYFDTQWGSQKFCLKKQQEAIRDFINYCNERNVNLIIRCPLGNPRNIMDVDFSLNIVKNKNCALDGYDAKNNIAQYKVKAEDSIYYSNLVVSYNSTMILETCILNKPTGIIDNFEYYKMWNEKGECPLINPKNKDAISNLLHKNYTTFSPKGIEFFKKEYGINDKKDSLEKIFDFLKIGDK